MRFLLSSSFSKVTLSCPYFMKLALQFPNKLISFLHVSQALLTQECVPFTVSDVDIFIPFNTNSLQQYDCKCALQAQTEDVLYSSDQQIESMPLSIHS